MLYLISLGIWDEKDMSLKALEAARKCKKLYLELYTSNMNTSARKLSSLIGKNVILAARDGLEEGSERILEEAKKQDIGILVPGDALGATTHITFLMEARKKGIRAEVIHGSSILTAVGETGLQLYKFGRTVTLTEKMEKSIRDGIELNRRLGLHTLVLLDIGMKACEGIRILIEGNAIKPDDNIIAACMLGGRSIIKYGRAWRLAKDRKIDKTPAVLIVPGSLHFMEAEFLDLIS